MKRFIVVALIVFGFSLVGGTAFGDETAVSRVTASQSTADGAKVASAQLDDGAAVQYQTHDEVQAMKAGNQTNHTLAGYTWLGLVMVAVTTIGGLVWQSFRREIRQAD
ncbi:hypothetical protein [Weissella sp. MSCH1]|uniref:hypothetical protein n=1 Tax=Weissella sp. MSCH1 TaxID=3383343 RepID=UPI003896D616